ncbi:MAG: hypothetical protein J6V53_01370 [Alphaproteobacteria bacterium]|nr:hypothetical protein [Alphaproteobacteria bacterium]
MLKFRFNKYALLVVFYILFASEQSRCEEKNTVSAYLRVKDEIQTIEACLNSIEGVFDRIVIIHSNEKDDGSVAFMNEWCSKRKECEIHEYPHVVIPSHDKRYGEKFQYENTLAARQLNGISGDSFFIKRKNINNFSHRQVYEHLNISKIRMNYSLGEPVWFHFMKTLKSRGVIRDKDSASENEVVFLTPEEKDLFEKEIRPLLKNSPYYHLKLDKE